jgi:hypothetical protein
MAQVARGEPHIPIDGDMVVTVDPRSFQRPRRGALAGARTYALASAVSECIRSGVATRFAAPVAERTSGGHHRVATELTEVGGQ